MERPFVDEVSEMSDPVQAIESVQPVDTGTIEILEIIVPSDEDEAAEIVEIGEPVAVGRAVMVGAAKPYGLARPVHPNENPMVAEQAVAQEPERAVDANLPAIPMRSDVVVEAVQQDDVEIPLQALDELSSPDPPSAIEVELSSPDPPSAIEVVVRVRESEGNSQNQ